jgi:hypothetical protein
LLRGAAWRKRWFPPSLRHVARAQVEQVASSVPNVRQVVNELQVKDQKASSTP